MFDRARRRLFGGVPLGVWILLALMAVLVAVTLHGQQSSNREDVAAAREAAVHQAVKQVARAAYDSQLKACKRGNKLRRESNQRAKNHRRQDRILAEFLAAARLARLASYARSGAPADLQAAQRYVVLRRKVLRLRFDRTPIPDCRKVIVRPAVLGPA